MKNRMRTLKLAGLLVLLVALPAGASHRFSDVPSGAGYHDEVDRLAAAGITSGCTSSRFCTDQDVTRWQMAYFLDRAVTREESATSTSDFTGASGGGLGATPVTVTMRSGGTSGATGQVALDGSLTITAPGDVSSCPCEVEAFIYRVSDDRKVGPSIIGQLPATKANGRSSVALPLTGAIAQTGARNGTYGIGVFINNGSPGGVQATGSLTATWAPYDGG